MKSKCKPIRDQPSPGRAKTFERLAIFFSRLVSSLRCAVIRVIRWSSVAQSIVQFSVLLRRREGGHRPHTTTIPAWTTRPILCTRRSFLATAHTILRPIDSFHICVCIICSGILIAATHGQVWKIQNKQSTQAGSLTIEKQKHKGNAMSR